MTPIENLHYAIGELAYAVARVDGVVQKEERKKFHDIVAAELRCKDYDFDVSEIIFQIIDKDNQDSKSAYESAMHQIRLNSHYLSPALKKTFIRVMEKIAKSYAKISPAEQSLIDKFKREIEPIQGDPVFYEKNL